MPIPDGTRRCAKCHLPYQLGRKARHDASATHRAAVAQAKADKAEGAS